MAYENNERKQDAIYSRKIRAGKRRTYFFDVKETRGNDYYVTITESCRRFDGDGYDRHKIFLYKEDFNKFIKSLTEAIDFVKTDLMPDFDFDAFNHEYNDAESEDLAVVPEGTVIENIDKAVTTPSASTPTSTEEVDKW